MHKNNILSIHGAAAPQRANKQKRPTTTVVSHFCPYQSIVCYKNHPEWMYRKIWHSLRLPLTKHKATADCAPCTLHRISSSNNISSYHGCHLPYPAVRNEKSGQRFPSEAISFSLSLSLPSISVSKPLVLLFISFVCGVCICDFWVTNRWTENIKIPLKGDREASMKSNTMQRAQHNAVQHTLAQWKKEEWKIWGQEKIWECEWYGWELRRGRGGGSGQRFGRH